jgi:hypothetical protein
VTHVGFYWTVPVSGLLFPFTCTSWPSWIFSDILSWLCTWIISYCARTLCDNYTTACIQELDKIVRYSKPSLCLPTYCVYICVHTCSAVQKALSSITQGLSRVDWFNVHSVGVHLVGLHDVSMHCVVRGLSSTFKGKWISQIYKRSALTAVNLTKTINRDF